MEATKAQGSIAALTAVVLFLSLWLPLGQLAFMTQHWMKVGTFAALFLLLGYASTASRAPSLSDPVFMSMVLLLAYIAHQFEEHWVDLLGNEYAFYSYVNGLVRSIAGVADESLTPLTPQGIYVINTSLVWLVGVTAMVRSRYHLFPAMAMSAIALVNGITHILGGLLAVAYNPGLLTSVLLFVPLPMAFYQRLIRRQPALRKQVISSMIWAVLAHVLMVGGMLAANLFNVIPEELYFGLLIGWSAVPMALFRGATG
ncbi:MAG: HXXEE domain-containing protein [Bacteroidota bacterium]